MPDVTLERQIYPNCNLNATKIKESTVSVAKVASNKSFLNTVFVYTNMVLNFKGLMVIATEI